jgi:hypothetical protein
MRAQIKKWSYLARDLKQKGAKQMGIKEELPIISMKQIYLFNPFTSHTD